MLIYYGIIYLNPKYVLLGAMLGCIVFSVLTGSSWGSIGTVGVAFLGISMSLGVPLHITAGAAVCGACFGDKLSPLSGTTNLASGAAGVDLYTHIRSMMWTTLPPTIIAGIVFFFVGNSLDIETAIMPETAMEMLTQLDAAFTWGIWPLLPFVIVLAGALTKQPPLPSMLLAVFAAILIGVFYQGFSMQDGIYASLYGFKPAMIPDSGEFGKAASNLLNRGGARNMVGTILIIYIGFCYAAIITKAGFLERAVRPLAQVVRTRISIMAAALATDGVLMAFSGSSPPATIMVPVMFKKLFLQARMPARVLSRSLEDVGTITTSFFPWTAEAVFYVTTMGVAVYGPEGFAPWFIVGYLTPLFALFYAWSGKGVYLMDDEERDKALAEYEEEIRSL